VVAELTGKITETIGGPDPGLVDGDFGAARFREPQGMALAGDTLYVADRGNHAIRAVDLRARQVATVAGTGRKGEGRIRGGVALQTDLRSPWDLAYREGGLDVAMAGSHQIWRLDLPKMEITPLAGSGLEQLIDGGFAESAFAQPSGLWLDGAKLYVADSETSAVREIDLARRRVRTLVGTGLFDFGFRDGQGRAAQLQHPIGIAGRGDMLYVADTFNSAVRTIDLKAGALVGTLHVTGIGGFDEPSGASAHGDTLYVADANNHRIVAIDLNTRVARALTLRLPD
jgi:DNA-binding beta-propeller fold protein YncE